MMNALVWHIAGSSLFALVVWGIAFTVKNRAAVRNRLWIAAVVKFAVPFSWLSAIGASVGERFPVAMIHLPGLYAAATENVNRQAAQPQATATVWTVCITCWMAMSAILGLMWSRRFAGGTKETLAAGQTEEAALRRCAERMQVKQIPCIRVASQLWGPCVRGALRVVIVVPQGLCERLGEEVFESVLMHELAHITRKDNLWAMAVHAVVCVFPWYPPLWWMEHRVRAEAELACDALALEAGAPREAYVSGLLEVCRMSLLEPASGSGFTSGVNLKDRLEWIMSNRTEGKSSRLLGQLGEVLLVGGCVLAFIWGALGSGQGMAQVTISPTTSSTAIQGCEIGQPQPFAFGTVIRHINGKVMQVCVEQDGKPLWLTLASKPLPAGIKVVDLIDPQVPSALSCRETAPHGKLCTCDNQEFSPGSVVNSTRGKLACPASGGQWQAYKGSQNTPWPPVSLQ